MRFRCSNPACGPFPQGFVFEGRSACPKCGATPAQPKMVQPLISIHLVVVGSGPIMGGEGRQHVACQPRRDALARHEYDLFAATGEVEQVTCPACMKTRAYQDMARASEAYAETLAASAPGVSYTG